MCELDRVIDRHVAQDAFDRFEHRHMRRKASAIGKFSVRAAAVAADGGYRRVFELHGAAPERKRSRDKHRELADLKILVHYVKDLAAQRAFGCFNATQMCLGNVVDIDERAKHPAAAVKKEFAAQKGIFNERVDDKIQAQAWAKPVYCSLTQNNGCKLLSRSRQQRLFRS